MRSAMNPEYMYIVLQLVIRLIYIYSAIIKL